MELSKNILNNNSNSSSVFGASTTWAGNLTGVSILLAGTPTSVSQSLEAISMGVSTSLAGGTPAGADVIKRKKLKNILDFRDKLVAALQQAKGQLEASWKAIETVMSLYCYRRMADKFFDILYTGGLLNWDAEELKTSDLKFTTKYCVLKAKKQIRILRIYDALFHRLTRYDTNLAAAFDTHAQKILAVSGTLRAEERSSLALLFGLFIANDHIHPAVLIWLNQQSAVANGAALNFLIEVLTMVKQERRGPFLAKTVNEMGFLLKVMNFMPKDKRNKSYLEQICREHNLMELFEQFALARKQENQRLFGNILSEGLRKESQLDKIITRLRHFQARHSISDIDALGVIWQTVMSSRNIQSSENNVVRQTCCYLHGQNKIFRKFCSEQATQIQLIKHIAEFCSINCSQFFRGFETLVTFMYQINVISEQAIKRWFHFEHGKQGELFRGQMQRFMRWLDIGSDRPEYYSYTEAASELGRARCLQPAWLKSLVRFVQYDDLHVEPKTEQIINNL